MRANAFLSVCLVLAIASLGRGADPELMTKARQSIDRGLKFVIDDAVKWRTERGCATCHHGTLTVWVLSEAVNQGFAVPAESLANNLAWTKERFIPRLTKVRDPRPGWNLVSTPGLYLGTMAATLPVLSRDEIRQVAVHMAAHQEDNGTYIGPPPANAPPPSFESPEAVAMWALLAWEAGIADDPKDVAAVQARREKTLASLRDAKFPDTNQVQMLRLRLAVREGRPPEEIAALADQLLRRQKEDGGFSQTPEMASDAFATGQSLWSLSFAGIRDRPEIERAIAFLVKTQREDGSWPMTFRHHPDSPSKKDRFPMPITYFGTAWGMIGLLRHVPTPPDTPARQKQALGVLQAYRAVTESDKQAPGEPLVSVEISYGIDDGQLDDLLTQMLAYPRLTTLRLKGSKITDAGMKHFGRLPGLRNVSLEGAPITDAGLAPLKALSQLESLDLKGTKVTDAGVLELQQALPKLKITR